jgi:hypothetical protein
MLKRPQKLQVQMMQKIPECEGLRVSKIAYGLFHGMEVVKTPRRFWDVS